MTRPKPLLKIDCGDAAHANDAACLTYRATVSAEKAAHEAGRSGDLSQYAIALSLLALIALIATILQGRSALRKSQRSNEISEDAAQRQLRAYVITKDLGFEWKFVVPIGEKVCMLWANLQNAGQTPTRDLRLIVGYDKKIPEDILDTVKNDSAIQSTPLGPGHTIRTPELGIPLSVVEEMFKGLSKLYLFGAAHYQDVFGAERMTRFCFEVKFSKTKDSEMPDFINWTVEGSHNCADDECISNGVIK